MVNPERIVKIWASLNALDSASPTSAMNLRRFKGFSAADGRTLLGALVSFVC
jgi:hypothetical protein